MARSAERQHTAHKDACCVLASGVTHAEHVMVTLADLYQHLLSHACLKHVHGLPRMSHACMPLGMHAMKAEDGSACAYLSLCKEGRWQRLACLEEGGHVGGAREVAGAAAAEGLQQLDVPRNVVQRQEVQRDSRQRVVRLLEVDGPHLPCSENSCWGFATL